MVWYLWFNNIRFWFNLYELKIIIKLVIASVSNNWTTELLMKSIFRNEKINFISGCFLCFIGILFKYEKHG